MIVYSVEFPASIGTSLDEVAEIAAKWLTGSPHYGWNRTELTPRPTNAVKRFHAHGQEVDWANFQTSTTRAFGFKHTWIDKQKLEWITEIVATFIEDALWVSARVHANGPPGAVIPRAKQPYIVKQLIQELGGGNDNGFRVSDLPISLSSTDVQMAGSIISGTSAIDLPVVYVSVGNDGTCYVDCKQLAKRLRGIAHVIVEPDRRFSFDLRDSVNGENPYAGAVGVFWPRGGGAPLRFLPYEFSEPELIDAIVLQIEDAMSASRPRDGLSWSALESIASRLNAENLRASGAKDVGRYIETFDAELASQKTLLAEANAEVVRLKAEVRRLQSGKESNSGTLRRGNEVDLFSGELRAIILEALKAALARTSEKSRSHDVLSDLIDVNAVDDKREEFKAVVKDVLSTARKLSDTDKKALEAIGFRITDDGKHYKATFANDDRYTFSIAKTASDNRSGKNCASQINRMMFA